MYLYVFTLINTKYHYLGQNSCQDKKPIEFDNQNASVTFETILELFISSVMCWPNSSLCVLFIDTTLLYKMHEL